MRKPRCRRLVRPICCISWSIRHPPPCTTMGFMPTRRSSATSRANPAFNAGSAIALPPKRITSVLPLNARRYGSASASMPDFWAGVMGTAKGSNPANGTLPGAGGKRPGWRTNMATLSIDPTRALIAAVACLPLIAGCAMTSPRADTADLQRQVGDTERAFAKTMADRDFAAFVTFLSAEAVFFTGPPPLRGRQQVAELWERFY